MSGTSLDGADAVLLQINGNGLQLVQHAYRPMPAALRAELMALNQSGANELHRASLAANELTRLYAALVSDLLGLAQLTAHQISAIGAHGQTVRHQPGLYDGTGYTLQLNNPALLAELTGIDVVADFRSRDVAAGGQGAPLVPAFHQAVFGGPGQTLAVLNLGGIANLSVLGQDHVIGFDCGPGNALMDAWCLQHLGQSFDADGQWAASGQVHSGLLHAMLAEPYFSQAPPKSSGRDLFHSGWLQGHLSDFPDLSAVDVQATLAELTASSCANDILRYAADGNRIIVCGGGALNIHLMQRLQQRLASWEVLSSQSLGLPPLQVEAAAFAWLARKTIRRETASLKSVTGARGARVLGAIYPA